MSGKSKRHHWWPVCHSSLWVDDEGCVTSIDSVGNIIRTQPINMAVKGHYNSVRRIDGTRDSSLEDFFATEIEGPIAPVLVRLSTESQRDHQWEQRFDTAFMQRERKNILRDGFVPDEQAFSANLSAEDRRSLVRYIASLIVRVPSYKDELNSNQMLQDVSALLQIDGPKARVATDTLHTEVIRAHLADYAERLEACAYLLIESAAEEFIIGDTPVIPAALGFGEAEVMCPLSPNRALFIVRGWKPPFSDRIMIVRSQRRNVRAFNRTMAQNAERQIFCRTPISTIFVRKHLGTRQVRLHPNIETAAGEHSTRGPMLDRP